MKKTSLFTSIFIVAALSACLPLATTTPIVDQNTAVSATATETFTAVPPTGTVTSVPPTATSAPVDGNLVFYGPVHLTLPAGLASGISGSQVARADSPDLPAWELTPGHTQVDLDGYLLQGKTVEPQIFVYPAMAYVEMKTGAFESIHRIDNILGNPDAAIPGDQLPAIPFFNDKQVFASNIQVISFQNGKGVRFLTEYAQYPASANNQDLFYEFQGLTNDGEWYLIVILPASAPNLAETRDAGAPLPQDGIPYPYMANPNADMQAYYQAVADLLKGTSPDAFAPALSKLDALIQSLKIAP